MNNRKMSLQNRNFRPALKWVAIAIGATAAYVGFVALLFFWPSTHTEIPSAQELPDSIVLDRSNQLPEVKAFLTRYPDAMTYVDRAEGFSANYQITQCELGGGPCTDDTSVVEPYVALHVLLDIQGYPVSTYLYCVNDSGGHKVTENLMGYLQNESCF